MSQQEPQQKKASPFDFVKTIRTKKGSWEDLDQSQYIPFIINRAMSFDMQSLFQANEINRQTPLSHKAQFEFYINSVSKLSGYSPWQKADKVEELQYIKEFYNVSSEKAKEILLILTPEQVNIIKTKIMKKDTKHVERGRI